MEEVDQGNDALGRVLFEALYQGKWMGGGGGKREKGGLRKRRSRREPQVFNGLVLLINLPPEKRATHVRIKPSSHPSSSFPLVFMVIHRRPKASLEDARPKIQAQKSPFLTAP